VAAYISGSLLVCVSTHVRTCSHITTELTTKLNSMALVRERTILTERPPPVGEVSATLDAKNLPLGNFITSSIIYKVWWNWVLQKYTLLNSHFWNWQLLQNTKLNFPYVHQTSKMSKIWYKEYLKFGGNTLTLFLTQHNITRTMCQQGLPQENTMSIIFLTFVNRV
jgi:hypothetical protein